MDKPVFIGLDYAVSVFRFESPGYMGILHTRPDGTFAILKGPPLPTLSEIEQKLREGKNL